jgi:GMP synthase-like glutamine amidotransferase
MRICILENEPESPAGLFEEWALLNGHNCSVVDVPRLTTWPEAESYELIVSLGSECSVHASPDPWIADELEFLREAHRKAVPVFGICFGGQALAAALGGGVHRASRAHGEWREIETHEPDLVSPGPWLRWHQDVAELPPRARLLAGTPAEPLAFEAGSSVGLQFHPEATQKIVEGWFEMGRQRLADQGIDAERLQEEIRRASAGARERAFALFDALSTRWLHGDDSASDTPPREAPAVRH